MQLACNLINIIVDDYNDMSGIHVNMTNAKRFYKVKIVINDDYSREFYQRKVRQAKAYDVLWRFLNNNMKKWWD